MECIRASVAQRCLLTLLSFYMQSDVSIVRLYLGEQLYNLSWGVDSLDGGSFLSVTGIRESAKNK